MAHFKFWRGAAWMPALLLLSCTYPGPSLEQPQPATRPPWREERPYESVGVAARQHTFATKSSYAHPAVSPDGKWIAYAATINGKSSDVFAQRLDGKAALAVASHPADDVTPAFCPDGKRIAFASNRDGRWNVYVAGLDSSVPVVQVTDDGWDSFAPSFSPDGKVLAYCTRRDAADPWAIALADLEAGTRTMLCEGAMPDFSPVGDMIVFSRNSRRAPGWPAVWTISIDGRSQQEIFRSDEFGAITPSFAGPDWIVFSTIGRRVGGPLEGYTKSDDIWLVNINGTQASRVTWRGFRDWDPVYDPRSERCFFVSSRDGAQNIFSVALRLPQPAAEGGGR